MGVRGALMRIGVQRPKKMTELDRDLIFKIANGDDRLFLTLSHWYRMKQFRQAAIWCLENKLTGKELFEWLQNEPHDGIFNGFGFILGRLRKDKKIHGIFRGIDYH